MSNTIDIRDIKKFQRSKLHDAICDEVLACDYLPDRLILTTRQFYVIKKNLVEEFNPNNKEGRLYITPYNAMDLIVLDN